MKISSQGNLIRILSGHNQWWQTNSVQKQFLNPTRRSVFGDAMAILRAGDSRILHITGPHRTGKTALLHQIIQQLIDEGTDPKSILYLSFAHPFFSFLPVSEFYTLFLDSICPDLDSRAYCFFDDVQLSPEWEKTIARLSAQNPNLTVVASGAVRPADLPPEAVLLHMPPISFYEYCQISAKTEDLFDDSLLPDGGIVGATPAELRALSRHIARYRRQFMRYLYTGGFLNLVGESDDIRIQRMIQNSVVSDALLRDICLSFNVRNSIELEKIFLYLCFESPGVVSYEAMMRDVDCATRPTIEKYVRFLARASLLYLSYPYDFNGEQPQKIQPKIYLADAAIRSSMLMYNNVHISENSMDRIVETAVYSHFRFFGPEREEGSIFYQRGRSSGKNLDMIVEGRRKRLFVDVRYDTDIRLHRHDAILARSGQADHCILITRSDSMFGRTDDLPKNVFCIPANIFLFLIGHSKTTGRSFLDGK